MPAYYNGLQFERLGHASVRIETEDSTVIYVDPWGAVIENPEHDADIIFVTHDDRDHYDADAIESLATQDTKIVTYSEVDTGDLALETIDLGYEDSLTVGDVNASSVVAYNDPSGEHTDVDGNPYHEKYEVIGLRLEIDGVSVYYTSDTDFLDEHETITASVFIPPIGGTYTMDRHEAAAFAEHVEAELVLPIHYNTDEVSGIDTDANAFKADIEGRGMRAVLF